MKGFFIKILQLMLQRVIMKAVACFGDSLIYGFPYGGEYSWINKVETLTGIKMLNYGSCGETCVDIGHRMRFSNLSPNVDALLFLGGANDVLQGTPASVSTGELKKVLSFAAEKKLPISLVLPFISGEESCNPSLQALRNSFTEIAAGKANIIDLMPAIGNQSDEIKAAYLDGFHPKSDVYERMGIYAAPLIAKWLDILFK